MRAHILLFCLSVGALWGCYPQTGYVPDASPQQLVTHIKQACARRDARAARQLHQRLSTHPERTHRASARARALGARSGVCDHY